MSDINPTGAASPSGVEPVVNGDDSSAAFDANLAAFLNSGFGDDDNIDGPEGDPEPKVEGEGDPAPKPAAAPAPAPAPNPAPAPAPANAEPPAANNAQGVGTPAPEPDVDPAALAAMLNLNAQPAPAPQSAPAAPAPEARPQATTQADEPFAPFDPAQWKLPPKLAAALFEAEDTETKAEALVGLLSSYGNALLQMVDTRVVEHHGPKFLDRALGQVNENQVAVQAHNDFYGEYPELLPHRATVQKAGTILASMDPAAKYTPETRDRIARLASEALVKAGVLPSVIVAKSRRQIPTAPTAPAPAPKAKGKLFEAGAARPGGMGEPADPNSPAAMLESMTEFN